MHHHIESSGLSEHVVGSLDAPAQLVLYGDYECRDSARAHFEIALAAGRLGGLVRYEFRHFPNAKLHPHAFLAAQAAEAAGAQGRFWAMHAMLLANHHAITDRNVTLYANTLGLDARRFARELESGEHASRVTSDLWYGARSGVTSAPTLLLNGSGASASWDAAYIDARVRALLRL